MTPVKLEAAQDLAGATWWLGLVLAGDQVFVVGVRQERAAYLPAPASRVVRHRPQHRA